MHANVWETNTEVIFPKSFRIPAAELHASARCSLLTHNRDVPTGGDSRAFNELLGKYVCSIWLPARGECDTFPAKERQEGAARIFPGRNVAWLKKEGAKREAHDRPHTAKDERKFPRKSRNENFFINFCNFYFFYEMSREFTFPRKKAVLRTDISKNTCRWLLLEIDREWNRL